MNNGNGMPEPSGRYEDIIGLPHHTSPKRSRMPMEARAAQFAPFAALEGYGESVQETARLTSARTDLSPDEQKRLTLRLDIALNAKVPVTVTYFIPDSGKAGGSYGKHRGILSRTDGFERQLIFEDDFRIDLDNICAIDGEYFDETL